MAVKNDQKLFKDEFFELIKIVSDPKCEETAMKIVQFIEDTSDEFDKKW